MTLQEWCHSAGILPTTPTTEAVGGPLDVGEYEERHGGRGPQSTSDPLNLEAVTASVDVQDGRGDPQGLARGDLVVPPADRLVRPATPHVEAVGLAQEQAAEGGWIQPVPTDTLKRSGVGRGGGRHRSGSWKAEVVLCGAPVLTAPGAPLLPHRIDHPLPGEPMNREPRSLPALAQEALDVQDASNISGVCLSFGRMMDDLCAHVPPGTDRQRWLRKHPLIVLWLSKLVDMTGFRDFLTEYGDADDACQRMIRGEDVDFLAVVRRREDEEAARREEEDRLEQERQESLARQLEVA